MTKIAGFGSASESISQRHGSADPDPDSHIKMSWLRNARGTLEKRLGDNCKIRKGSGTGEDRVPRGLALDEERLDRAGPGHLQAAREVPQSPGKKKRS